MSKLSTEDWKRIENALKISSFGTVELRVGEDKVTLTKEFLEENKLCISVYINDYIKLAWGFKEDANHKKAIKLWRQRTRSRYPPAKRKQLIKLFGKRKAEKNFDLNKKIIWYEPYFPTFNPLKTAYKKLDDIELIKIN